MSKVQNWKFHFKLSDNCFYSQIFNSEDIELELNNIENREKIVGFWISVKNSPKNEAIAKAKTFARRLTNIIAAKHGTYLDSWLYSYSETLPDGTVQSNLSIRISGTPVRSIELNLNDENISSLIYTDSIINQQLTDINRIYKAYHGEDYITVIRDFDRLYEYNWPSGYEKYRHLRNSLSHKIISRETIDNVHRSFGEDYFDFTSDNRFDFASEKNETHLREEANNLIVNIGNLLRELNILRRSP